ncbi:MAG: TMEM14 family protein [Gemmataceae bacterium]
MMWKIAAAAALIYGLVSIGGGTLGYVNKGSIPSIAAGGIAGILLILCAAATYYGNRWGLIGSLIVSLALVGRFASSMAKERDNLSAFFGTLLGQVALVIVIGGLAVLILSAAALTKSAD